MDPVEDQAGQIAVWLSLVVTAPCGVGRSG